MNELRNKTVMVVTDGYAVSHARRLGRDFGRVFLHTPMDRQTEPTHDMVCIGEGFEDDNIIKVESIFKLNAFREVDIFYFPDEGYAAEQEYLRSIGKCVWGAGYGERLEQDRAFCKSLMRKVGLPVGGWNRVHGITALRHHLQAYPNQWVKVSFWRGYFESFFSPTYKQSEQQINQIAAQMGPYAEHAEFIVEDNLPDKVETGIDTYVINGKLPKRAMVGIEDKDLSYTATIMDWDEIPEPIRRWHELIAPELERSRYCGWLSTELRIGPDKVPYMIDATCRAPAPPSELFQEQYANFSEIVWAGAHGEVVDPIPKAKWGCQVLIECNDPTNYISVGCSAQYRNNLKLYYPMRVDGITYVPPREEETRGAVIGMGRTLNQAMAEVDDVLNSISSNVPVSSHYQKEDIKSKLKRLQAMGLGIGGA